MKRHLWWALSLACVLVVPALAQTTTGTFTIQRFADFLQSLPAPSSTLGASDKMPILQNGATKGLAPLSYFLSRDGSNVSDAAAARGNLSAMARDGSDATLPDALQNLGLQIPGSCDGFSAEDGAITSGTANFSSASASFATSDVGKRITIAGAGAVQHLNIVTLVGGGVGHTVGEVIPLDGGTGTAASIVVRAVAAGVITEIGLSENLGAYSVVPSGTISAGDATLTATWLRDALVTTIASVDGATSVTLAASASATVSGASWGYGSDYSAQINAALAVGTTQLPKGTCGVASQINIASGYVLRGASRGQTTLIWLGASRSGAIIGTDGASGSRSVNVVLQDMTIEGLGSADTCLYTAGSGDWRIQSVTVQRCVTTEWSLLDTASAPTPDAGGFHDSEIIGVTLDSGSASTASSMPMRWGGYNTLNNNAGYNRFVDLKILYKNQFGWECGYADNNHIFGSWFWRYTDGVSDAINLLGDVGLASCQSNSVYGLTLAPASAGTVIARNGVIPSRSNALYTLNISTGVSAPIIETGAALFCQETIGSSNSCSPWAVNASDITINRTLKSSVLDDGVIVAGGNAAGSGANIELYGPSAGSANNAFYDAATHIFRDQPGTTTVLTADPANARLIVNRALVRGVTNDGMLFSGGSSVTDGARIELYGSTAGPANQAFYGGALHTFRNQAATNTTLIIDADAFHVRRGTTTAPALTSCGATPAISGTDFAGTVTMGTGSPTGCVITFNTAYGNAPHCTVTWQANLASMQYSVSSAAITLTQTATSSNKVDYICIARGAG